MKSDPVFTVAFIGLIIFIVIPFACYSGAYVDRIITDHRWEADAGKQGYAHYDTTNGAWTWNNGSGPPKDSTP